ncbi:MAG: hypothetical protein IKW96_05270 [Ruminococcus sp.]|uniref:hypothetical protein n=1 Tax=Ruminococcus sp. TaxID=41978 RepID=UPI0025EA499E|nr:hypothetical protein [Ruminococcus sp.]MBR5682679.1 hypothetical protein [Ruminococcus sp.]
MIAVRTKPSRESLARLWKVQASPARTIAALAVFLLIMAVTLISTVISLKKCNGSILLVVLAVVTACADIIVIVRTVRLPSKRYAAVQKSVPDLRSEYTFGDDHFTIHNECTGINEHIKLKYSTVKKVVYNECWFVVITGSGNGIAFHENSFANGTPQELSALLREKIGKKYKVR